MRQSNSIIRATKWSLHDRLATNPFFANIPGFVRIPKSIQSEIAAKAYPAKGVAFLIGEMRLHVPDSGTPGPYFNEGSVTVELIENVQMNANTGLPDCDETGEKAMELLHLFTPDNAMSGQCAATVAGWGEEELDNFSIRRFMVNIPMGFTAVELPAMPPIVIAPNGAVGGVYPMLVSLTLQTPRQARRFSIRSTVPIPRRSTRPRGWCFRTRATSWPTRTGP